jgi:hypothetical protein
MRQIFAEARAARDLAAAPPVVQRDPLDRPIYRADLVARIVQRHTQFGRRCRLDIGALVACAERLQRAGSST